MLSSCALQPFSCPLSSSHMKFNLPHKPPPTLSLSAGGSSKVFTLTRAVRLDKVTAGPFSSALYLLLLLGKPLEPDNWALQQYTITKRTERKKNRETHGEKRYLCGSACACVWGGQCVCEVKCSHCKSKASMKYECSTVQAPDQPCRHTHKKTQIHIFSLHYHTLSLSWSAWFPLQVIMIPLLLAVPGEWRSHSWMNTWYEMLLSGPAIVHLEKMGWAQWKDWNCGLNHLKAVCILSEQAWCNNTNVWTLCLLLLFSELEHSCIPA